MNKKNKYQVVDSHGNVLEKCRLYWTAHKTLKSLERKYLEKLEIVVI